MSVNLPRGDAWEQGNEDNITTIKKCYCPHCGGTNGESRMLPTKIPGFREIIILSLSCPDCSFRNSEVSFGGEIQPLGERLVLTMIQSNDGNNTRRTFFNRQILKSDAATLRFPSLDDLEIPSNTHQGVLTTVEGILSRVRGNLLEQQPQRLHLGDVENFHRCQRVIDKIQRIIGDEEEDFDNDFGKNQEYDYLEGDDGHLFPFQLILDDPAGNSFIENPYAPNPDPYVQSEKYERIPSQDIALGLQPSQQAIQDGCIEDDNPRHKNVANTSSSSIDIIAAAQKHIGHMPSISSTITTSMKNDDSSGSLGRLGYHEALKFPTACPHCRQSTETKMCVTNIPHFKEVIIMSLVCEQCGYRSNEVKNGGAIPKFGSKITLVVAFKDDLGRDVLKSDTAGIEIPEIELQLNEGGLDGVYTTVEGLLTKMKDRLERANPFGLGDSAIKQHISNDGGDFSPPDSNHARFIAFLQILDDMSKGRRLPFTLIITDPLANSFVGPIEKDAHILYLQAEKEGAKDCYESYRDRQMSVEEIERTHEQNELLGLNDIKTEGYGNRNYYGTDQLQEVSDQIRRVHVHGPDHTRHSGKPIVD